MISKERQALLDKVKEYEKKEMFDVDVNIDPVTKELLPEDVDYLCKKFKSKIKRKIANFIADKYFLNLIKKDILIIDKIENEELLIDAFKEGAIVTCNHFSPFDNYIVFHSIRKYLPKKYLYKVIREGNYTNFPGLYGFFFRNCNTLPLSSNKRTMMNFLSSVSTLLKNKESILIYPEQAMWWNYKKPRPFKIGAFKIACKNNVPIVPLFISFEDDGKVDNEGENLKRHTLHVLKPLLPNNELKGKEREIDLLNRTFLQYKEKYEEVYQKPLVYKDDE